MNRKDAKRKAGKDGIEELKGRRMVQRRMTCPNPIAHALQTSTSSVSPGATLDDLIQYCLRCFDSEGKLNRGGQLVNMTLMMHSWVVPSHMFAHKLLSIYPTIIGLLCSCRYFGLDYFGFLNSVTYKDCPTEKRVQQRPRVCHLIRQWICQFPSVFETDPLLEKAMQDLRETLKAEGEESHSQLVASCSLNAPVKSSQGPSPCLKKRKVSLLFDHMEADEMAELLTYLEFKNFCKVTHLDYRSYVVCGSVQGNPALESSIMLCNGVSQWVQLMILSKHTAQQRAQVFTKFIHVAQKLRSLQNFNTLMAVMGGLCHSAISRLKDTASFLSPEVSKTLSEMTELLSSYSNYSRYRRVYSECLGFKVPILGVHLKDLISLNEALPDYLENDKINIGKLQHLYSNIMELLSLHECTPPFEPNKDLLHLLTLSLDLYYTEDEIYELSYAKEQKNPKIQPPAPVSSPVVVEWGSHVTVKLDPDTISKHVQQMVDSIMKNYDPNLDGYISLEDFEKIAANFPFSFCTHDSDREGQISREEITSYFIRGMSVCAKLGFNFQHNFHETTYKKPTFCNTCGGFLWGVIKQGYHCKDCGMNCHKHCREQVGMECMKRYKVPGGSCPCTPVPDSQAKGNSWSSEEDTFVFPNGNCVEQNGETTKERRRGSTVSDRSTQTEPGVWTPENLGTQDKSNISAASTEKEDIRAPLRNRGASMPACLLQEKMKELHLQMHMGGESG